MAVPLAPSTGPGGSPDCCGPVVHPEAAVHPEHLHPLPVSVQASQPGTIPHTPAASHALTAALSHCAPSLPSVRLDRPCFVMTASCESPVRTYERFTVTYTLLNNLQDFLAVRLVWTPEHAQAGGSAARLGPRPRMGGTDEIVEGSW